MATKKPRDLPLAEPPEEHPELGVDYTFNHFELDVDEDDADVNIAGQVTAADLELTIEGASVLRVTVDDTDRRLFNSTTLNQWAWGDLSDTTGVDEDGWVIRGRNVDARLNQIWFRLVRVQKNGDSLTLEFEDRMVSWLRNRRGPLKATRGKVTRAQFVRSLLDRVKINGRLVIPWVIPELYVEQPVQRYKVPETQTRTTVEGGDRTGSEFKRVEGGASKYNRVYRQGEKITFTEVRIIGESLGIPPWRALAWAYVALGESGGHDRNGIQPAVRNYIGDGGTGVVQMTPSAWGYRGPYYENMQKLGGLDQMANPAKCLMQAEFMWKYQVARGGNGFSDWNGTHYYSQAVNAPRDTKPVGGAASLGTPGSTVTTETTKGRVKPYEFIVARDETYWDATGRLAQEVGWRRFVRRGSFWFASEEDLFDQKPELVITEGEDGVDSIDPNVDLYSRKSYGECTVHCRADRWTALPGSVVVIRGPEATRENGEKYRKRTPLDGRWLVTQVRRQSLFDAATEIQLAKPIRELAEPAPEVETVTERSSKSIPGAKTGQDGPTSGGGNVKPGDTYSDSQVSSKSFVIGSRDAPHLTWWHSPSGRWTPVASWLVPQLKWARSNGWDGNVTDGYRSYEHQAWVVQRVNAGLESGPAAPAGTSKHGVVRFPGGAVDVANPYQFLDVIARYPGANRLKWYGSGDKWHFSLSGN